MKIYDYDGRKNISGERIRELRCKRHWSQDALAKHLQLAGVVIGRDSVNRIEKGTRFVADYEIRAFSQIFDVPVQQLLDDERPRQDVTVGVFFIMYLLQNSCFYCI